MLTRHSPSNGPGSPDVWGFYEKDTGSIQYLVADPHTRKGVLIDVVQDFDPAEARTSFDSADEILDFVERERIMIERVLDTHPHSDHVMASSYLKEKLGVPKVAKRKGPSEKTTQIRSAARIFKTARGLLQDAEEEGPAASLIPKRLRKPHHVLLGQHDQ
mgnify:CR=1 FL=1